LRGTRLYCVTPPDGGSVHWVGEMMLNGSALRRRFASELYARVWLSLATDHSPSAVPFDLEEHHGTFRAAGVAAGSIAPVRRM
jgi:hypothetical protein